MLIDHDELVAALDTGHVAVAALDVFEPEPPAANDALIAHPHVIATPHSASTVPEAEHDMELIALNNLIELFNGQVPDALLTSPSSIRKWNA